MMHKNEYPLKIEDINTSNDTLTFTAVNNTDNICSIHIDNTLIKQSSDNTNIITMDISDAFQSRFKIKLETDHYFIIKTVNRDDFNPFQDLKKTLRGKNDYYFLVNDKNNEIRQHYDQNYKHNLDIDLLKKSINSKRKFLESHNIDYGLFIIPDKSITLRNKLPFSTQSAYRHTKLLKDEAYDLNPIITEEDRLKNDSHINYKSSAKIVSYIISCLSGDDKDDIYEKIRARTNIASKEHYGDLFIFENWSYDMSEFNRNKIMTVENVKLNNPVEEVDLKSIPEEFRYMSHRKSHYYKNPDSISDKRAIILHDSTANYLEEALKSYYSEVFFYWDHWFFNDKLVEWFHPDEVVEIRTERFLDNPQYPIITDNYKLIVPVHARIVKKEVKNSTLYADIEIKDYRQMAIKSRIVSYVDDKLVKIEENTTKTYHFELSLDDYEYGEHKLKFKVENYYKTRIFEDVLIYEESLESLYSGLKSTLKGNDDTFFLVNDSTCELRQHYDPTYDSSFDSKEFIKYNTLKKSYLEDMNINYCLGIIPDKSVVMKEYLPFNRKLKRNVDSVNEHLVDSMDVLGAEDYLLNDTNISMTAGVKLVSHIIAHLEKENPSVLNDEIMERLISSSHLHRGNLFTAKSWSYPEETQLRDKYYAVETVMLKSGAEDSSDDIPPEFRMFSSKKSEYFVNYESVSEKRAIVLCDDSIKPLVPALTAYYRNVLFYEDYWYFNKDLVSYYRPDDLLEIRAERSLETYQYQTVSHDAEYVIPVTRKVEEFCISNQRLKLNVEYSSLRHLPVKSRCVVSVDDVIADIVDIDGVLDYSCRVGDGEHSVSVLLEATLTTKENLLKRKL